LNGLSFEAIRDKIAAIHTGKLELIKSNAQKFKKVYSHVTGCDDND